MSQCSSTFTRGECPGHLGKFQDCEAEALWTLSLDQGNANAEFGDTDWHGYFAMFLLDESEGVELDPDGEDERIVVVPAGNYLLRNLTSGAVVYEAVGEREHVISVCQSWEDDYAEYLGDED